MSQDNKTQLAVIVNGQATVVDTNLNSPLGSIIEKALHQTGNSGQPPENWELRDAAGQILDLHKKIGDYHFAPDTKLFLNLKAGVGGSTDVRRTIC